MFECKKSLKLLCTKEDVNVTGKLCNALKTWLIQNRLLPIENDEDRTTCIICNAKKTRVSQQWFRKCRAILTIRKR